MMSPLRLRHLEVFLAVVAAGSMQRAVQSAHLSQPAISKLIRELENMFGVPLLERGRRGVKVTECGQALADRSRLILNEVTETAEELTAIGRGAIGRVRVGVLPVVEAVILPNTLLALRKSAPGLSVQVEEGTRTVLLNALRHGEVDCVVGRLDTGVDEQDMHIEKLLRMPTMLVVSPSHPLARAKRISWSDLAKYPWVLPQQNAPIRTVIDGQFIRAGIRPPTPSIESTSSRLNYAVVRGTDMITVMTQDAALGYIHSKTLVALPIDLAGPLPHVGVITRTKRLSQAVNVFLIALRAQCKSVMPMPVP